MTLKSSTVKAPRAALLAALLIYVFALPASAQETNPDAQQWVDLSTVHSTHNYHHPDVSPDGKSIVFSASPNSSDQSTLWIQTIASGKQRQLTYVDTTMGTGDVLAKWSPRGDLIGFASDRNGENHLYTVPVAGGEITRLTQKPLKVNSSWYCFFSWGPDGRKIVFGNTQNENENLYIMDIESQTVEQLTHHTGFGAAHPGWSPDGASIVYVSIRDSKEALWIYDLASRTESIIETSLNNMSYPVWSPDGQWIAFQRGGTKFATYIISRHGGEVARVGPGWAYANWGPAWDSDGKHLVYHASEVVDTPLMVYELASGANKRLQEDIKPTGWQWASWSPQGTYLAFHQITENAAGKLDTSLYLGNVNNTEVRRITPSTLVDQGSKKQAPAWMPEGRRFIAILEEKGTTQLAMIAVDDPSPRLLTRSLSHKMEAVVSPDGELVAYIAALEDEENIWLYDLVTDEEIQLTFSKSTKHELAFSPDGTQIAFVQKNTETNFDIMSIATEGGDIQQHTRHDGWELHPKWIDNETIYFTHSGLQEDTHRIAAQVNIRSSQFTPLLSDGEGHIVLPYAGPDLKYIIYQRGWPNGPLVWADLPTKTTTILIEGRVARPLFNDAGTHVAFIDEVNQPNRTLWRENVERIVNQISFP